MFAHHIVKDLGCALVAIVRTIVHIQQPLRHMLPIAHFGAYHLSVALLLVTALVGCSSPTAFNTATAVPTQPRPTREAFLRQLCTSMGEYEQRHRAWHAAHPELNDHHWEPSFVPIVHDPLLPVFDNPPAGDEETVAALKKAFENASAKFKESADKWAAGDKQGAEVAESEAFMFLFDEFARRLEAYGIGKSCFE